MALQLTERLWHSAIDAVGPRRAVCQGTLLGADAISRQINTLSAYRKSLIHECVTGQRRVTEADLNRVRAHG